MCSPWIYHLNAPIIDIFHSFHYNRGMIYRINLYAEEGLRKGFCEAIGKVIYVELDIHGPQCWGGIDLLCMVLLYCRMRRSVLVEVLKRQMRLDGIEITEFEGIAGTYLKRDSTK